MEASSFIHSAHHLEILLPNHDFIMSPHVVNEIKKYNKCYLCCHSWHVLNTVLSVWYKPVKSLSFAIRLNLILSWPDHWKRPQCWERLKARGEGDDRGWDGWMASQSRWTWVWASSKNWWWTGKPGMLQSKGVTESDTTERLNWTEKTFIPNILY